MSVATKSVSTSVSLDTLIEKERVLRERRKQLRALQERQEWERKTKARNPAYVMGSLRPATSQDEVAVHGWVCQIKCETCGDLRIINKQDAFQARFCKSCVQDARKTKSKVKRLEKRVEGKSTEDIEAEIARLDAAIAQMQ